MQQIDGQWQTDVYADELPLQSLQRISQLPAEVLIDAAEKGAVWASLQRGKGRTRPRRLRSVNTAISEGSSVMLNYNSQVLAAKPQLMRCIAEHVNYGIWFKPSGMMCQGSKWSDHTVVTQVVAGICGRSCFLVHRLDRAACGLIVIAYTKNAQRKLAALFEQRRIGKTYVAQLAGKCAFETPLTLTSPIDDKPAVTRIKQQLYNAEADATTVMLAIETGRKHQIRKHLADIGHPIVGDRLYGTPGIGAADTKNLQLVASGLDFQCPFSVKSIQVNIDAEHALAGGLPVANTDSPNNSGK